MHQSRLSDALHPLAAIHYELIARITPGMKHISL